MIEGIGSNAEWSLPAAFYRDEERYRLERKLIFETNWLLFTWSERLASPGDYVSGQLAGYNVFAIRGDDGKVRAFHNVCRHRAAELVSEEAGRCGKLIVCPYHSWSFKRDGRLNKASEFGTDASFDPDAWALHGVDCEEWRGLVFLRIRKGGPSLLEWLGPVVDFAAPFPLEKQHYFTRKDRVVDVDWKAYGENYLECYHCRAMHPGLCATLDIDQYKIDVYADHELFHLHAPGRAEGLTQGCYLYRFPFLMLNLYDWGSSIATVEPMGPGRLKHINWYFFEDVSPEKAEANQQSADWSAQIITEDLAIITGVQRNLNAGVYTRGALSKSQEAAVIAFDRMAVAPLETPGPHRLAAE